MTPHKLAILFLSFILTVACSHTPSQSPAQLDLAENRKLNQLVDEYSQKSLQFSPLRATYIGVPGYNDRFAPPDTEQLRNKRLEFERAYLDKILQIDVDKLTGNAYWTYKIFRWDREQSIRAFDFPFYYFPFNQMYGLHNTFAELGSGESAQPFNTLEDYENFIKRARGFSRWADSAIGNMQQGIIKGYTLPRAIVKKILPQLKTHIVNTPDKSLFYQPLKTRPAQISESEWQSIKAKYMACISGTIIPTYQKLYQFMQTEYLPAARQSVGLSALPKGLEWYQFLLQNHTTLPLGAEEIHQFGLQEVARIRAEMNKVKKALGFQGDLQAFFAHLRDDPRYYFKSEEELIDAYQQVKRKIESKLGRFFNRMPKAPYEVRAVPKFRQASAPGAYYNRPSADGSRPGVFYINSYNLKAQPRFIVETLSIHEAAPGHHFQIALQQELDDLPMYRRFGGYTVFSEGWALYTEFLGKEMGLFTDPLQWYGRLSDEQLRAMRLVVDTGLHAKGWSREQAIQYMIDNSSMAKSDIEAEVERYMVIPGQAVSYKVGERFIRQLRNKASKALGRDFDLRDFHTQVLDSGQMPMWLLEEKIKRWIESQGKSL